MAALLSGTAGTGVSCEFCGDGRCDAGAVLTGQ
jgi:hypothetical protein